jgi:hypothetical protein
MNRIVCAAAVGAAALGLSTVAMGQETDTAATAGQACELHVFPTVEGQAQTTSLLSGFGVVGAVADAANNKGRNISNAEYLRDALGPQMQMEALQSVDLVAELKLPAGTQVIFETPIADRKITTKATTRLTDSAVACYAELIVTQNLYQKKAIYGRSLNNRFIFKDFRGGRKDAELVKGRGGNGLSQFPPEDESGRDAADQDLREAFTKNFLEYSKSI